MSENTAAPDEPQPASNHSTGPDYGVRLPEGNGQPASWAPAWHPEATPQAPLPRPKQASQGEDIGRGTIFALAAMPLGIIVWMVIWNFGWITSFVTFGVAALAARLYVMGTGGTLSRRASGSSHRSPPSLPCSPSLAECGWTPCHTSAAHPWH